jgi:hypothetical protein
MEFLSWREVDFAAVILAGVAAGYVMAIGGLWVGRIPGFVAVDIADFGRRYMVSDRPSAWLLGFVSHLTNSVLLVLVWTMAVLPNVALTPLLAGLLWGEVLAIGLAGLLVGPLSGMGPFGMKGAGKGFVLTNLLIHAVWGLIVGGLYTPP